MEKDTCRICLDEGAIYPIFQGNDEFECLYPKLAVCIREKLEDIEGYPNHICIKCKTTCDSIKDFIVKFEKSSEILKSKVVQVKTELQYISSDDDDNGQDNEPFIYELEIFDNKYEIPTTPKDPSALLQSLSHLTVKRIKLENDLESHEKKPDNNDKVNEADKTEKRGLRKSTQEKSKSKDKEVKKASGTRKAIQKKSIVKAADKKKPAIKPAVLKKVGAAISKVDKKSILSKSEEEDNPIKQEIKEKKLPEARVVLCDVCGASFADMHHLKVHISKLHAEKKYKCTKCPKEYYKQCHLDEHQLSHGKIRNFVCNLCGKGFFRKKILRSHLIQVHDKTKKKVRPIHKCRFCDKTYGYKRGVVIHERSVHTGERPDVCSICGSSFYDAVYLREHMRIHTGETLVSCPVCGRGYAQRGNMKSHLRNHKVSELPPDILAKIKPSYFKFMNP